MDENLKQILDLAEKFPKTWPSQLGRKKSLVGLLAWLVDATPKLGPGYSLPTRLYWLVHGLSDFPVCPFCHQAKLERNVASFEKGWTRACSRSCPGMKATRVAAIRKTCQEKYGSDNWFSSEAGKKAREDFLVAHGVDNAFQLEGSKAKSEATLTAKTGYAHAMQNPATRALASERYAAKTGYAHQFADPEVAVKARAKKAANREAAIRAGADPEEAIREANREKRYAKFQASDVEPLFSLEDFKKLSAAEQYSEKLRWKCRICGKAFESPVDQNFSSRNGQPARCPVCHPKMAGDSEAERELAAFVASLVQDVVRRDRTTIAPLELDVYIPSKKIAFEYDGLFWHSAANEKSHKQKLAKTEACEKAGVQLVHVFENEWLTKRDIVESRIRNLLGSWDQTIYARKCEIREVDPKTSRVFQEANHLQGATGAKVRLGLYFQDELVSLMTFSKCRFDKTHEWELVRFCSKLGCHVVGAAGKLLKAFEKKWKPASLVSYADRRWSMGKLYEALGFKLLHASAPNYWYFRSQDKLFSRVAFQKHKLPAILDGKFDPAKSEVANMEAAGWNRIFDCGNLVYEKDLRKLPAVQYAA